MTINVSAIKNYLVRFDTVNLQTVQKEFSLTYSQVRKLFNELLKQDAVSYDSGFTYKVNKSNIVAWGDMQSESSALDKIDPNDELLLAALWSCIVSGNVSASRLQRELSIGYVLAYRLVDRMNAFGLINYNERKVLITAEEYVKRFGTPFGCK